MGILRDVSLLLENPWEEHKKLSENDIRGASDEAASSAGADSRPSNIVLAQYFCVLPRGFSSKREIARVVSYGTRNEVKLVAKLWNIMLFRSFTSWEAGLSSKL